MSATSSATSSERRHALDEPSAHDRPPVGCRLPSSPHLGLACVPPVVGEGGDVEGRQHLGGADVIAVLVRDPHEVDRRAMEVGPEPGEEVAVGRRAHVPAARAPWVVARVDEDVATVWEVDEDGERLVDVIEVDDELPSAPAGRGRGDGCR